jgi:Bacterial regulatory proteins, luxR family
VTSRWVLTDQDVRNLLAIVERCQAAGDRDIFYPDVLLGLRELIPCEDISFQLMDVREQRFRQLCVSDDGVEREETAGVQDEFHQVLAGVLERRRLCGSPSYRRLCDTGASDIQIARALGLSQATVPKHLENIFLRLHVLSRTEALARIRPFIDAA